MKKLALLSFLFLIIGVGQAQIDLTATGGDPAESYLTLKGAFDAINAGTHTGTITIGVSGDATETATAVLNASGAGAASYTSIGIQPTGGSARIISGAMVAGSPLIDFNGADNVTIDGLNTGGNSLIISNTTVSAISGTSTIRFIGGATTNTITNCFLQGSGTMSVATNGAVIFFSTDALTASGNDNNTISNNDIGPAGGNLPTKCILGNGSTTTTAIGNSGMIITGNTIHDFFGAAVTSSGIVTNGGCNTWTITNNKVYQSATRTWTTGASHIGIDIRPATATSGAQGFTITGNTIGYANSSGTGVYTLTGAVTGARFVGILFNGISTGAGTTISNNTVTSVSMTGVTSSGTSNSSPFTAILAQEGNITTNNNVIGSQSATGSLTFSTTTTIATDVHGIYNLSSNAWTTNSNSIGGISATNLGASGTFILYGMRTAGSTVSWSATSNTIGGTVANSMQLTATGAACQLVGMANGIALATFTSNTVRNLTSNIGTGTAGTASVIGINITTATPSHTLSQNTIYNLSNTNVTQANVVTGIQFTGSTANLVERNLIYGLSVATNSATAEVNGIRIAGGTTTYRNNMIALGTGTSNAIGAAAANASTTGINGIMEASGTNTIQHNSIYIGGTATAGTGASYAFNGIMTANTRSFRNNIFVNNRANSGATGKHYSIKINGTAANPAGLTINNNLYFGNGAGNVFGFFNSLDVANLAAWQTAVGQDAVSYYSDPQYVDPIAATPDLHINTAVMSYAEQTATNLGETSDFDGNTRSALTPHDIGADAMNGIAPCLSSASITPGGPVLFCSTSANVTLTAACTANCGTVQNYSWSPAAGLSATSGAVVTATPTVTTTYVLTTTSDAGCAAGITSITVTLGETPIITSLSATPAAICSSSTSNLSTTAATTSSYGVSSITFAAIATPGSGVTTLANGGTAITALSVGTLDDGQWNNQSLPFTFTSFGASYTQFTVSTNGVIYLGSGAANNNQGYGLTFPNTTSVRPCIAAVYADLTFGSGGVIDYFTTGTAPNRAFVINFTNGEYTASGTVTTQLILYETTHVIEVHTTATPGTDFAVQGLQNSAGTIAFTAPGRNRTTFNVVTPDAYRFTPNGGGFTYSWTPTTGLSDPAIANPVVSGVTADQTYTVTVTEASGCSVNGNTSLTVYEAEADDPADVTACDSYTLPALTEGNYFTGTGGTGTALSAGNAITSTQTIYVYAETGTTPNCTDENSFLVTINTTPNADDPADVTACDSYTLPALTVGNYFTGAGGTGTALSAGNAITSTQTIYVYAETGTTPNCTDENSFVVTINTTPNADDPADVTACDSYTLPALTVGNYFTGAGGTGTALSAGNAITSTQTIYVYAETGTTPNCTDENSFVVTINTTPNADDPADVTACDSYTLPALTVGNYFTGAGGTGTALSAGNAITSTQTIYVYAETATTPNCTDENSFVVTINTTPNADDPADVTACDSYTLPALTVGNYFTGAGGTGTALSAGNAITSTQTIYVYAETGTTPNCTDENSFVVTINTTPVADDPADVTACNSYTLPALTVGNYFTGAGGTGTALSSGNAITSSQTIYVYAETGTTPNCTDENSFVVTINTTPNADDPADVTACDSYTLPALTVGNYFTGTGGTGTAYSAGNVISADMTMYVYAATGTTPNCSDENSFTIDITTTPTVTSSTGDDRCGTGTVDLLATASAGVINWFTGASGGASIGTGSPFTTPSISTTTAYYAEAMDGTCASAARTAVTATVEQTSQVQASQRGSTLATVGTAIIADAVSGATHYRFEVTENGNTEVITRTSRWMYLANLSSYDYSKTYSIRVAVEIGGIYYCYGTAYNVSSPALPTTSIQASQCGATLPTLFTSIQADQLTGATKYRFEVSSTHGVEYITNTTSYFYLNQLSTYTYGTAYTIRVAVEYNSSFGAYGSSCVVKSPAVTTLQASQCNNSVMPTASTAIVANEVSGATGYKFEVTIDGVTEVLTRTVRWFYLANLSSYGMNKQLRVRVAVQKDGVWGPFYTACFVKTPTAWMAQDETIYAADGDLIGDISVEAYPNPNSGDFTVSSTHEGLFNIINELGQVIQKVEFTPENGKRVNVEGLKAGVYFLTGTTDQQILTRKVVVQ